ncbi:MAG: hypothetical protein JNJ65_12165 [Cyclobacteriaceae bacterium]|nr:hypothetical protein [Cyclobacteriaceae bacterium]
MKSLKNIFSVSLALLVLVASSSFTVNMHVCGGIVQSLAVIEKAAPCPMELNTPACHKAGVKKSCCLDEVFQYEGQDFKVQESATLLTLNSAWIVELPLIMEIVSPTIATNTHSYKAYKPPLLQHDIPVLIQSFLI